MSYNNASVIAVWGSPGSGKSTYAKKLCSSEVVTRHLSSDKIREELYGDESIQSDPRKVFDIMRTRAKEYLNDGCDVVYDATNVTRKNRRGILADIKNIVEPDGVEAHIVWAPYQQCVARDTERRRTVGHEVIRKMLLKWESPFYDEGFNKIKVVYNCDVCWDRIRYSSAMLENMNIPHDNPHHTLNIAEHSAAAESYCLNMWGSLDPVYDACAYHDIGKPFCKGYKSDKDGKLIPIAHYYQHDHVGGYFVYGMYSEGKDKQAILTSWLVCNHMQPYFNSSYYKNLSGHLKSMIDKVHEADVAAH